ncbi:hypothetical protein T06_14813 [Trichinella sp. T6]|nr:hypothetical protein T06_14813 [Trichinella sp. T6]
MYHNNNNSNENLLDLVFALAFPFSWSGFFLNVDNKIKLRFQKMTFACWRLAISCFVPVPILVTLLFLKCKKLGNQPTKKN